MCSQEEEIRMAEEKEIASRVNDKRRTETQTQSGSGGDNKQKWGHTENC
jgi:hypothetical protein